MCRVLFSFIYCTKLTSASANKNQYASTLRVTKLTGDCCCFWFLNVLVNYLVKSRTGPKTERLTILRAATHEIELGDHDFCLSRSHYTDTDPTSRERADTAWIEPGTSSPGVARCTDWATAPPKLTGDQNTFKSCEALHDGFRAILMA